jgi:thiamine kinase-like enzyme
MENMYNNYSEKMIKRYHEYDYTKFKDSDKIYNFILHYLKEYENKDMGIYRIIHGDPVFTNIIINRYGKIKMIDMRGKLGNNNNTIYGDVLYDWAKIYQSLIGYDEFLEDSYLPYEYKNKFIYEFERIFIEKFGEKSLFYMKVITASLLFSLIPLHNNEKCTSYYNLIFEIDIIKMKIW